MLLAMLPLKQKHLKIRLVLGRGRALSLTHTPPNPTHKVDPTHKPKTRHRDCVPAFLALAIVCVPNPRFLYCWTVRHNNLPRMSAPNDPPKAPAKKEKAAAEKAPAAAASAAAATPKSFVRRDHLREIEIRVQKQWEDSRVYQADVDLTKPKFFLTFPFPYMNGKLHLGHAFSGTKSEFTARFQRLLGKNVLYPFGFHCTGMPIQAAANKLRDELAQFGNPPVFPDEEEVADAAPAEEKSAESEIAAKSKGKKTKLAVKGLIGKPVRQWDILAKMVPVEEIASFADPMKWLEYFPPYGIADLKSFGSAIDWRRSFITTSANQYFDRFIRWQFNRLREGNRIKFGKRASVYSILDGQVCADHDRASGEGVGPQEYTLIKLLIIQPYPENSPLNHPSLAGKKVFLAPATLRPETMYGQVSNQYSCLSSQLVSLTFVTVVCIDKLFRVARR
jgi:hypothetical protein